MSWVNHLTKHRESGTCYAISDSTQANNKLAWRAALRTDMMWLLTTLSLPSWQHINRHTSTGTHHGHDDRCTPAPCLELWNHFSWWERCWRFAARLRSYCLLASTSHGNGRFDSTAIGQQFPNVGSVITSWVCWRWWLHWSRMTPVVSTWPAS
jgi:hypothetical protein